MNHRRRSAKFNRKVTHRKALFRSLMIALVEHGRIRTTLPKAKEIRRHIERVVTKGKDGSLATLRLLMSRIPHKPTVKKLVSEISPRFKSRPGGYTRIIKLGKRPGDMAEMAFIEWVDFDYKKAAGVPEKSETSTKGKKKKADEKAVPVAKSVIASKVAQKRAAARRKTLRKIQASSRAQNR